MHVKKRAVWLADATDMAESAASCVFVGELRDQTTSSSRGINQHSNEVRELGADNVSPMSRTRPKALRASRDPWARAQAAGANDIYKEHFARKPAPTLP